MPGFSRDSAAGMLVAVIARESIYANVRLRLMVLIICLSDKVVLIVVLRKLSQIYAVVILIHAILLLRTWMLLIKFKERSKNEINV